MQRIQHDYEEQPSLRLTPPQAQRLWNLDGPTCGAVLTAFKPERQVANMWKGEESVRSRSARPDPSGVAAAADSGSAAQVVLDLGHSVVIHGEVSASEDVTLYGQMEGSIKLPDHTLTIGPHAHIKAEISAKAVVIMGEVIGNVTAADKVEIRATGSVTGDIASPRLAIADGGCLCGRVAMPHHG